jgi:phosphoribosyl-dephospho-CoA transferase
MESDAMRTAPRPHDLLRLTGADVAPPDAPGWVGVALRTTPWVVVRRAESTEGLIAVGVRGRHRADRYAMTVDAGDVIETRSPEALTRSPAASGVPAMQTLNGVRAALDRTGLSWGPTGSVGFELATGVPTATGESDLDLLVRVARPVPDVLADLTDLSRLFIGQPARIDCQIETLWGAVALTELVADQPEILIRTAAGPRLVSRAVAVP